MKPLLLALVSLVATVLLARAQAGTPGRQAYGPWQYNKEKNYHFREYKYKVKASDKDYQHEYCIYYRNDAKINNKWVYFYNPQTQKFWSRYPTVNNDQYKKYAQERGEAWSILPMQYRQKDLYQINQKSWPTPRTDYCPTIPGATDGTLMMAPPADLP